MGESQNGDKGVSVSSPAHPTYATTKEQCLISGESDSIPSTSHCTCFLGRENQV